jgi:hypothetical protein
MLSGTATRSASARASRSARVRSSIRSRGTSPSTSWCRIRPTWPRWEPEEALFAGADGLDVLRGIVAGAADVLAAGGLLAVEVGDGQAEAVAELAANTGAYTDVQVHDDLAGRQRIATAEAVGVRPDAGNSESSAGD